MSRRVAYKLAANILSAKITSKYCTHVHTKWNSYRLSTDRNILNTYGPEALYVLQKDKKREVFPIDRNIPK